jgi:hypothetical protein
MVGCPGRIRNATFKLNLNFCVAVQIDLEPTAQLPEKEVHDRGLFVIALSSKTPKILAGIPRVVTSHLSTLDAALGAFG